MTNKLFTLVAALLFGLQVLLAQNLTFIQVSDIHVPHADSLNFVRSLKGVGPVYLAPYQITCGQPAFVVATGDVTEFGGGYMPQYLAACSETALSWYHMPGNHDNTWYSIRPDLRKLQQAGCYGFSQQGCHFIVLDSATPQDPRPGFGREQYEWLGKELAQLATTTPLFVFCHHPFGGSEFASAYEQTRLLDLLRPYNVVALIGGHYHKPALREYYGFPVIVGGQGYADLAGYNVFTVKDGQVWVAYRKMSEPEARTAIFHKDLRSRRAPALLALTLDNVVRNSNGVVLELSYELGNVVGEVKNARLTVDDSVSLPLSLGGKRGACACEIPSLLAGQHYAVATVDLTNGDKARRSFHFEVGGGKKWECQLPAAFKAGIAITGGRIYAAGLDGHIYAIDKNNGKQLWSLATGGEILGRVACAGEKVYAASGDGKVYAIAADGTLQWVRDVTTPIYAPLATDGKHVFAADRSGGVHALNATDGIVAWQEKDATYTIESAPCLDGDSLFLGAWDCYLYRYRSGNGELVWKTKGVGSAIKPAPAYYSPADCSPVVAGGKLYAADRAYLLGEWQLDNGALLRQWEQVAAVSLNANRDALYLRKTTGALAKMNLAGETMWSTADVADSVPTPACEFAGKVYLCSGAGKLSALDAASGQVLWQYQVTPGLRVFGEVAADAQGIYIADMDGKITAIAGE